MTTVDSGPNYAVSLDAEKHGIQTSISAPAVELLGEEARSIDPEIETRVIRKIDLFLMPAMVLGERASYRNYAFTLT